MNLAALLHDRDQAERMYRREQALADYCEARRDHYQRKADDYMAERDRLDDLLFDREDDGNPSRKEVMGADKYIDTPQDRLAHGGGGAEQVAVAPTSGGGR